jgi:hypothetical protein
MTPNISTYNHAPRIKRTWDNVATVSVSGDNIIILRGQYERVIAVISLSTGEFIEQDDGLEKELAKNPIMTGVGLAKEFRERD